MKRTSLFSKGFLFAAVLTMSLGMTSCKDNKETDPAEAAEEQNEEKFDDANNNLEDDSDYLVTATEVNMKEIKLGKLAQERSANPQVKEYAQMLVEDHNKASEQTKQLAQQKNITLPMDETEDVKEAYEDLNDESAADFDKKYIDMMIDGHEKTIDKMEDAADKAEDADIKAWAAGMLPTLREHLAKAKSIKESLDAAK
ncbi:DUF4142 domain-containing protein [Flavobacterium rhizosphaerae]|uniref:DUF4142 domain-containing protein n=1 Tax=Flavobacterium rhizosphaerae TaxID=3163298 RepID=A0ABW8YUW8_9FLAO